jgi:hypothetical protein
MRWAENMSRVGEGRSACMFLVGRCEGKRPLGRPRRRRDDNIKMDFVEIGIDCTSWICQAQDRVHWRAVVNTVMNLLVSQESGIFFDDLINNQFLNNILHHGVIK